MGMYLSKPDKAKSTQSGENVDLAFGACSMRGWRKVLEDTWVAYPDLVPGVGLFAIFDGHGGPEIANFCKVHFVEEISKNINFHSGEYKIALEETFIAMDSILLSEGGQKLLKELCGGACSGLITGCTAIVVLITHSNIFVANAGDSKALAYRNSNEILPLSTDHLPNIKAEIQRIKKAGGYVAEGRVCDNLNLTRAIGDLQYKQNQSLDLRDQIITSFPDVVQIPRQGIESLALGCDGIWEKYSKEVVFEKLRLQVEELGPLQIVRNIEEFFDSVLAADTMDGEGCDNMTCIFVNLKKH
jgi:serine/threonine protein phosphatase PrpC